MAFWATGVIVVISFASCIRSTAEEYEDQSLARALRGFSISSDYDDQIDVLPNGNFPILENAMQSLGHEEQISELLKFLPETLQNVNHNEESENESKGDSKTGSDDLNSSKDDIANHNEGATDEEDESQSLNSMEENRSKDERSEVRIPEARRLSRRLQVLERSQIEVLNSVLKGYDANEWPHFYYGKRTDVHVQMFINAFGSLDAASMDFRIDLFLRQMWQDPRLAYSDKREHLTVVNPEAHRRIWRPDTYFDNVKVAKVHDVTVPNVMLRISRMGDVMYTMRLALVLTCNMQLRLYPFDTQYCYVELSSLSSTDDMVAYHWHDYQPVKISQELEISEFDLIDKRTTETKLTFATGNYSGLQARFTLRRQNGFHLLQTYVPTILIVSMSWVSFWLDPNAVPGRVTLGVTTLLTLTTLASGVRQSLPKVSYVKAIDVWLGMCMIMIFGALIEFTAVNSLANKKKDPRYITNGPGHNFIKLPPKTHITQARRIDGFSRIAFPATFLLFNIFYWTYYILRLYQEVPKTPFTF